MAGGGAAAWIGMAWGSRVAVWSGAVLWAAGVTALSSLPGSAVPDPPFEIPHLDKVLHFLMYAVGAALLSRGYLLGGRLRPRGVLVAALATLAAFAMIDEYHQTFVPNRSGLSVGDLLADFLGAACGAAATLIHHARQEGKSGAR